MFGETTRAVRLCSKSFVLLLCTENLSVVDAIFTNIIIFVHKNDGSPCLAEKYIARSHVHLLLSPEVKQQSLHHPHPKK